MCVEKKKLYCVIMYQTLNLKRGKTSFCYMYIRFGGGKTAYRVRMHQTILKNTLCLFLQDLQIGKEHHF